MSDRVTLLPIDQADVTILVDNFVDILLPGTEMVRRAPLVRDWSEREQLIAEHGYSLLLTVQREGRRIGAQDRPAQHGCARRASERSASSRALPRTC